MTARERVGIAINPVRIAEALFLAGVAAQGYGVYHALGVDWAAIVLGTEMAAIGIIGVIRA